MDLGGAFILVRKNRYLVGGPFILIRKNRYLLTLAVFPLRRNREELHASTVQHPRFPNYRWLLHTKRVPVLTRETEDVAEPQDGPSLDTASERARVMYRNAGIGDPDQTCWLCKDCRNSLCHETSIRMPGPALANYMWGGREQPLYQ